MKRTFLFVMGTIVLMAAIQCSNEPVTSTTTTTSGGSTTSSSSTTTTSEGSTTSSSSTTTVIGTTTTIYEVTTTTVFDVSPAAAVSSANFTSYSVDLDGYGYKIYFISNYTASIDETAGWQKDAIVYEIYIRSFFDGSGSDGKGDLAGLTSKLSYVTNIGFNAIWTTPIFPAGSTHGYDVTDYYNIASDLGGLSAFTTYVSAAHNKGIHVILDMVINHTGSGNSWFQQSAANNATCRDWYCWTNVQPQNWPPAWGGSATTSIWPYNSTRGKWYYTAFEWDGMPDLNYRSQAVRTAMTNVAQFWLAKGADAFRLDAARYIFENGAGKQADQTNTIAWWRDYGIALRRYNGDAFTVGEVWCDNESDMNPYWNGGVGLDQVFNFQFAYAVRDSVSLNAKSYLVDLINAHAGYGVPWSFYAPFTDNHDNPLNNENRLMDSLGNSFPAMKAAAAIQMTFPGTPYVYYGTEIGMRKSTASGDEAKRSPMQWNTSSYAGFSTSGAWTTMGAYANPCNVAYQAADTNSLLNTYKKLIALRKTFPALRRGGIRVVANNSSDVLTYIRPGTNGTILVVVNLSSSSNTALLNFTGSGLSSSGTYPVTELVSSTTNGGYTQLTSNYPSMYVRGTFNGGWNNPVSMTLVSNNVWCASVSGVVGTDVFKFDAYADWSVNWGDNGNDGVAGSGEGNITVTKTGTVNFYFNDNTLHYWMN